MSNVEIGEIVVAGRAQDDVEVLNEKSDDVDGELEVSIEEEQNRVDVAEVFVSVEICVDLCWRGKGTRLLKGEQKKMLKGLRQVILISEKTQLPSLINVNAKELKEALELVNSVIHNVITNSINEMNTLLYAGAYVVAKNLGKMKNNKSNEKQKEPWSWWKRRIQANFKEWRKDVTELNERWKSTLKFEKKDFDRMERKYKLSDVGNVQIIYMLKEKISAGAAKIRPYEARSLHLELFCWNEPKAALP